MGRSTLPFIGKDLNPLFLCYRSSPTRVHMYEQPRMVRRYPDYLVLPRRLFYLRSFSVPFLFVGQSKSVTKRFLPL